MAGYISRRRSVQHCHRTGLDADKRPAGREYTADRKE